MSIKEAERLGVMRQIDQGTMSLRRAAEMLCLSKKQVKRIRKRYSKLGAKGIISLRKGARSANKIPDHVREKSVRLLKEKFADFGPTLAQEKFKDQHDIILSRETIRKWMIEEDLWKFKIRKRTKVYQRRTRRARFGEMLQADGSSHDWFEGRSEKCCLILFVDDATSRITAGNFFPTETTEAYQECLKNHLQRYGRPQAIYVDKHSTFRVNREELKKGIGITHFGRVMKSLDIELICANSPQAKGRVERKNAVLQDRLVKEMRLAGINTMEEANVFLPAYIEEHNQKFGKEAACKEDAHCPLRKDIDLRRIFARHEKRKLSKNLTFQYRNTLYQMHTDTPNRLRFASVDIFWRQGEPIEVEYEQKPLKYTTWQDTVYEQPKVLDAKELEMHWKPKKVTTPSMNHPWKQWARKTA